MIKARKVNKRPVHIFVARFADRGTTAVLRVPVPKPGVPESSCICWYGGPLHPADQSRYEKWRDSILRDLQAIDGRQHWFEDAVEEEVPT